MKNKLVIATRKSPLALWQANEVMARLKAIHSGLNVELLTMSTKGDRILDAPLAKIGGKGLFVKELEVALLNGEADIAEVYEDGVCNIDTTADNADHLCYYATSGAYSTANDPRNDAEGYVSIKYGDAFTKDFYNDAEIVASNVTASGDLISYGGVDYFTGNVLTPGSEIAITFKLGLPEPCYGDFSDGDIYFWGEAI